MKTMVNTTIQQKSIKNGLTIPSIAVTDENNDLTAFRVEDNSTQADETAYLLRSAENRRRLLESIAQLDSGQGVIRELIE